MTLTTVRNGGNGCDHREREPPPWLVAETFGRSLKTLAAAKAMNPSRPHTLRARSPSGSNRSPREVREQPTFRLTSSRPPSWQERLPPSHRPSWHRRRQQELRQRHPR